MTAYKPTLVDRLGPDGPAILQSLVWSVILSPLAGIIAGAIAIKFGAPRGVILLSAAAGLILGGLIIFTAMHALPNSAGSVMAAVLQPSGDTTPYETDYSYELALAMRGDVKGALASFEAKIASDPTNPAVKLKAAEMHASAGNADRALNLYRDVQRMPGVAARDDVFASYRLIDLYRGKLGEPGKSLPEFRRLIERYPDSEISRKAREALTHLKKEMSFD